MDSGNDDDMSSTEIVSSPYSGDSDNTIEEVSVIKGSVKRSATSDELLNNLNTTSEDEHDFTEVKKRPRRMQTGSDNKRISPLEGATVIFAPIHRDVQLAKINHLKLSEYLASELPGRIKEIRWNPTRNIIAVDVTVPAAKATLMKLTNICAIPVHAYEPRPPSSCFGVLKDVDPSLSNAQILEAIKSDSPVLAARRIRENAGAIRITFLEKTPPQQITFHLVSMHVYQFQPRALQCEKCYRYGHISTCCNRKQVCANCGSAHENDECQRKEPLCVNCGGTHSPAAKDCPELKDQKRIARARSRSNSIYREAKQHVAKRQRHGKQTPWSAHWTSATHGTTTKLENKRISQPQGLPEMMMSSETHDNLANFLLCCLVYDEKHAPSDSRYTLYSAILIISPGCQHNNRGRLYGRG
ncbi:uncharacterized protein LOC135395874 [Ornithodoros turicata]|uniref:uncharacterized protein LOC135395874 n=1 Tax=Ornithodoros turicata TaxID=34597 RepID=UPI0031392A3E